ncbi:MAG TPA: SMP-30/gluconolactonase/LRE family protein, partial [Acidobacteriota bacterium]|nr:SMP-30/gluconolactonase/LRE family protein [Acidobacteriota bacterium]
MKIALTLLLLAAASAAFAVSPQFWEENSQDAFAAGDPRSVSINSDGEILLAPQLKKLYEGSDAIIWQLLADSKGNLLAATGNDGRVLRIDTSGKSTVLLDTNELEVQAILLDKNDNLYAATSPEGKIYQVKPNGTSHVFFDPEDKYIWSLAIDSAGNLYAGTGDQGKIYKIDPEGKGKVLIDTNESNITALAWDASHNLLAGSDRNGILYRIDSEGKAFVLYDSDMQQITSIYPAPDGSIYFSAVASVPAFAPMGRPFPETTPQPVPQTPAQETPQNPTPDEQEGVVTVEVTPSIQPPQPPPPSRASGVSQLYRLTPDGSVELMFNSAEDQILDIIGYKDNQVLISTGKKSKLIAIDADKKSTILLKSPEEQLSSLVNRDGRLIVASANPGNIYELVETHTAAGTHFSDVKDSQTTSTWGQIRWKAD